MDFHYAFVYTAVNVFCVLTTLLVLSKLSYSMGSEREVRVFRLMTLAFLGFLFCELIWGLSMGNMVPIPHRTASYLKIASTLLIPLMVYFWFVFAEMRFGSKWTTNRGLVGLAAIPVVILVALYFVGGQTNAIFGVDAQGELVPGPAAGLTGLVDNLYGLAIIIHALILLVREKVSYRRNEYYIQIVFIVLCTIGGIIDAIVSQTPVMPLAITLSFIFLLTNIQESQIYNDALTGLNNRRRGDQFVEDACESASPEKPFYLFMIDLNKFKIINDTYGHIEGDKALRCAAQAIANVANMGNGFAARWGGDEFIVVLEGKDVDPNAFAGNLAESLKQASQEAGITYPLQAGVGYARCDSSKTRVVDLVAEADEKLYQNKKLMAQAS